MPSNFTEHYSLSQWERTDKVQMEDFNADNAKIDSALKAEADARSAADAALQTVLKQKGNCSVGCFTYTGNGRYGSNNPTRITFPKMPAAFFIFGGNVLMGIGGAPSANTIFSISSAAQISTISLTWSGSTVSFYDSSSTAVQMNGSGTTYFVLAFYTEN